MTQEQYENWKDFARRMVNVAVNPRAKAPSRAATLEIIDFFFECRMDPGDEWSRVVSWDHTEPKDAERSMCVSDHLSDIEEYHVPGYWLLPDTDKARDKIDRWMGPAQCCIRAGLDLIAEPSAGVAGFTAGDLRKMYPEGVPDWVAGGLEHRWSYAFGGELNGTFASMPDDAALWL